MYAKLFESQGGSAEPRLTDEGRSLCAEADVKPEDLIIRKYSDF